MWKAKITAVFSVANVGLWCGLLTDFGDAATRVGSMFPVIEALLPVVALAGASGAVMWLLIEAWMWRPSYRLGQRLKSHTLLIENIRSISTADLSEHSKARHATNLILEAKVAMEEQFEIPCPGLEVPGTKTEREVLSIWLNSWSTFAAVLLPRVRVGDLKNARRALNDPHVPLTPLAPWGKST